MRINREEVARIKELYPVGTRIRLNHMDDPYAPVPAGTEGTVTSVDDIGTLHMRWDNGRSLAVVVGEDDFSILHPEEEPEQGMTMTLK